jgi:hypothetical protein
MKKTTLAIAGFVLWAAPLIAADEPYGSQPVPPSAASEPGGQRSVFLATALGLHFPN